MLGRDFVIDHMFIFQAGKFHMIPLLLNLGAGIGLLGIVSHFKSLFRNISVHLFEKHSPD